MKAQQPLPEVPEPPQTTIYRASDKVSVGDFDSYIIEHEREVQLLGRINNQRFSAIIQMGTIRAYYSPSQQLLLLSGKKADILDFCNHTAQLPDIKIATIDVDMKALLKKLGEVKLAWFRFQKGLVRASALMGAHLEKTDEFKTAKTEGDISTLSFHFENDGDYHPVMVTDDGAVVLQGVYKEITSEIDIALNLKRLLLDGIYQEQEIRASKHSVQR
jgi:hypothetical protein